MTENVKPDDAIIRDRWTRICRMYQRGHPLGQRPALSMADQLERVGVTEEDIDRVMAPREKENAVRHIFSPLPQSHSRSAEEFPATLPLGEWDEQYRCYQGGLGMTKCFLKVHFVPRTACVAVNISEHIFNQLREAMGKHTGEITLEVSSHHQVSTKLVGDAGAASS